jgi:hypothetical protein
MNHQLPPQPTHEELASANWRKAAMSQSANGCVEVAHLNDWTAIRDSKNPGGPVQLYTRHEWACFLNGAAKGEFNRD